MKNVICIGTLLMSLVFATSPIIARQLTPQEALENAGLVGKTGKFSKSLRKLSAEMGEATGAENTFNLAHTVSEGDDATVYVFNRGQHSGYVVLAANDEADNAILGFSAGHIDPNSIPESMEWLLTQYSTEIQKAAERRTLGAGVAIENQWTAIEPLVTTKWDQVSPFNDSIPLYNGTTAVPAGCVAIAFGQVMKYHAYPEVGVGSRAYSTNGLGVRMEVNFAQTNFQWDLMDDLYTASSSDESRAQVATLMKALGVATTMKYSPGAASTNYITASRAIVKYFNYSQTMRYLEAAYFDYDEWITIVYNELAAGRPVLYGGTSDVEGGHAFVCDGYSHDNYFHINWGWRGTADGYFLLSALNPGSLKEGFNNGQSMVVGVQPPKEGDVLAPVIEFSTNFEMEQTAYPRTTTTLVRAIDRSGIFNMSVAKGTFRFGLKLVDPEGNVEYVAANANTTLVSGEATRGFYMQARSIPEGECFEVSPAVRDANGEWHDALVRKNYTGKYYMTVTSDSIKFSVDSPLAPRIVEETPFSISNLYLATTLVPNEDFILEATFEGGDEGYDDEVRPLLMQGNTRIAYGPAVDVKVDAGQVKDVEWEGEWDETVDPGEYELYLVDAEENILTKALRVTVLDVQTSGINAIEADTTPSTIVNARGGMIRISSSSDINQVRVYDLRGIELINSSGHNTNMVEIQSNGLQRGIYLVKVKQDNDRESTYKMKI